MEFLGASTNLIRWKAELDRLIQTTTAIGLRCQKIIATGNF